MLRNDANDNNNYNNLNWASHIKQILNEIGMSNVCNNQYNLNTSNLSAMQTNLTKYMCVGRESNPDRLLGR